jgi:hypothetical protein
MNENLLTDHIEEVRSPSVVRSLQTIVYGGLCVGTLDGLAAIINAGLKGVSPDRVFHYIASGLIGTDASYSGGAATVILGILLHFSVAFGAVAVFFLLSRSFPVLLRRAVISGMLYGIAVYFAMAYLIVPLSAVPKLAFSISGMMTSIVIHMFCVGLPAALVVRQRSMSRK